MNKPVAWIGKNELQFGFTDTRVTNEKESWDDIPLYTHPVKELTLTHEEYDNIFTNGKRLGVIETENRLWKAMNLSNEEIGLITTDPRFSHIESPLLLEFAKAILRKAQEK